MIPEPNQLRHTYVHRKNKSYVIAIVSRDPETGVVEYQCLASDNGLVGIPTNDVTLMTNSLPKPGDNIYLAASSLAKYLSKIGYKTVTKITQTKNGVKLS